MSQTLLGFLGYGKPKTSPTSNALSTTQGLTSTWYRSDAIYQLERRAIFSRRWILVSHKNRFGANGDYVRFEEAGFQFFLCKDREGKISGFHNTCRHRAFPIVTEPRGQARILACKYHGWTYGLNGKLTKAPGYEEMEGFDRLQNNLFPINVHIDAIGFIWVNLDVQKEVQWDDDFKGVDKQERFSIFNFDDYRFDHTWEMSGEYNWKTLADNYNECYHCPTSHPDVRGQVDVKFYSVDTNAGHIQHQGQPPTRVLQDWQKVCSTYYFPNACMTVTSHFFYLMRCVPTSVDRCSMEYEVYRHKDASDEDFNNIDSMFKRVLSEDKWLCTNVQKNLSAGVFVSGEMHSRMEKGPLYVQQTVRRQVQEHYQREKQLQREIWPARQLSSTSSMNIEQDESFCASVACQNEELVW
ncbi:hypothetical protein ACN47E_001649 [Coniothyrium glycines]